MDEGGSVDGNVVVVVVVVVGAVAEPPVIIEKKKTRNDFRGIPLHDFVIFILS
jgi:hypothetical protein